jgi:molybdopterin-guanine dinucleotide biosynthesis protein
METIVGIYWSHDSGSCPLRASLIEAFVPTTERRKRGTTEVHSEAEGIAPAAAASSHLKM